MFIRASMVSVAKMRTGSERRASICPAIKLTGIEIKNQPAKMLKTISIFKFLQVRSRCFYLCFTFFTMI